MVMTRDFSGKLVLDLHPSRVGANDYAHALNITHNSQGDGVDQVTANIVGNRLVEYTGYQPDTVNICIGAYPDSLRNNVIFFVWNNQGYHSILKYDNSTRTITKILESRTDSNDIDILNFQLLYKINSIDIIHQDTGDLLFFTDGYNRPFAFNIALVESGSYGIVTQDVVRFAKMPPLDALLPVYGDQFPVSNVNNFKKKLFRFRYRWVYKDGYKSTWSPISKCILPINAYSSDIESDPSKNNQITLTVTGGGTDYQAIEIAGQLSIGNEWGDWFLIDGLDKDDYNIQPGNTYNYIFLNDGEYIFIDPLETDLLYSYVPQKAGVGRVVNGNVMLYGNITEGYDAIRREDINVQLTASLIDTNPPDTISTNPSIEYNVGIVFPNTCPPSPPGFPHRHKTYLDITIGSEVATGDTFYVKFDVLIADPVINVDVNYVALPGDTQNDVAQKLRDLINAQMGAGFSQTYVAPNKVHIVGPCLYPATVYQNITVTVIAATPSTSAGGQATWKPNAKYRMAIAYFDQYSETPGAVSFVSNTDDASDFSVTTPDFSINPITFAPRLPVINASISHLPPSWAVRYQWLRAVNESISYFIEIATIQVQSEGDYYYFCIEGLDKFKEQNTGFVPSYSFQEGDRLRILVGIDVPNERYFPTTYTDDFEILGTTEREISTTPSVNGTFLKVKKNSTVFSLQNYMIEVYRPAVRTSDRETAFFEFGESYPIYTDIGTGVKYHGGQIQNQTVSQPATFTFTDGDVYYKFRPEFENADFEDFVLLGVLDENYSDYWASAVNSNGRPLVIDVNAKQLNNPVLVRFGQAYQSGTNINGLNIFYPLNFDEYFRDYGAIMAFSIRDKLLRVYQKLRTGRVPIFGQIIKAQDGTDQLVVSDKLLNPIQYYEGQFGIGDHPESIASNNYADYFATNIRGTINRLSQNGLEPISITNQVNNFAVTELGARDFNYKAYGVFDAYNNLYILALEETPTSPAKTLVWNEERNGFESFIDAKPEMMACLDQMLIMWKDGQLYTHDSDTYNNFFGVQYDSSITSVFNDNRMEKKTWMNVTELASATWDMPEISTNVNSYGNTKQASLLLAVEFNEDEAERNAVFRMDSNSQGGINEGSPLKGTYMIAKFRALQPAEFTFLDTVSVGYKSSPKNIEK